MIRGMRFAISTMLFLIAMTASAASLADEVIAAYGGRNAWKDVQAVKQSGTIHAMRGDGATTRELVRPDKLRVTIRYPQSEEVRVVNGDSGSRDGQAVTGPMLDAMILQAARVDLPMLLIDRAGSVTDRGTTKRDGVVYRVLEVALPRSMKVTLEVDPRTHRIVRSIGSMPSMSFETIYSDFRTIDGRLFAMHETNIAAGTTTGETSIEKVEVVSRGAPKAGSPRPPR